MFDIKLISKYLDCPMKLYNTVHGICENANVHEEFFEIKKFKIHIEELLRKNVKNVKKDMTIEEIEKVLSENVNIYINNVSNFNKKNNISVDSQINEIKNYTHYKIKTLSFKLNQAMNTFNSDAYEIYDMFFPECFYDYLLKDEHLGLTGLCEKTEIIEGKYYPILLRDSTPPINGVWNNDAILLAAQALLLEKSFNCNIYVGFVDYEKILDRRSVVFDANLKKKLFTVMNEINLIIDDEKLPIIKKDILKCRNCEFSNKCIK